MFPFKSENALFGSKQKKIAMRALIALIAIALSVSLVFGCVNCISIAQKPLVQLARAFAKTYSSESFTFSGEAQMSEIDIGLLNQTLGFDISFEHIAVKSSGESASVYVSDRETTMKYSAEGYTAEWKGKLGAISRDEYLPEKTGRIRDFFNISSAVLFRDYGFIADKINASAKKEIFVAEGFDECFEKLLPDLLDDEYIRKHLNLTIKNADNAKVITAEFKLEELLAHLVEILSESKQAFKDEAQWEQAVKALDNTKKLILLIKISCNVRAEFYIDSDGYLEKINSVGEFDYNGESCELSLNAEYSNFGNSSIPQELKNAFDRRREMLGEHDKAEWDEKGFYISEKQRNG